MKLPINWLKEYIKVPENPKELIDTLTSIGHMQDGPPKQIAGDIVYDLEIRQNRSDCLSIIGLAQEASAALNEDVKFPELKDIPAVTTDTKVVIENPDLCYRFETLKIENIKLGPSPDWLKSKLEAYGVKSNNNVVDITNFVMIEMGEPMHAYDTREIQGVVHIRKAKKGEKLIILGGKELTLIEDDLVIADDSKILSLAGVVGGEHSAIKNDTTAILLEDATYNQASIRRTSIRHQVRTEASTRHEKFLHPELTTVALQRAAQLLVELAGGTIVDHSDTYPTPKEDLVIELHEDRLVALGGVPISLSVAQKILEKLGFEKTNDPGLKVRVPYWRTDILQEADLIEEVLRIYGYDKIPASLPNTPPPKDLQGKSTYEIEEKIKDVMVGAGYDEQITEPLTKEDHPQLDPVKLENSLNADKTMLRTTMKNSILMAFNTQQKYRKTDIRIFEVGKIYFTLNNEYKEEKVVAGISSYPGNSFANVKGVLEELFSRLNYEFNENIITIDQINSTTYYFEVKLNDIVKQTSIPFTQDIFTQPPQVILQDLSLHAPENVNVGDVIRSIQQTSHLVYRIKLGETPQKMKDGGKSIFLNVTFFSANGSISNQDVEVEREKIRDFLEKNYQIRIR